MPQSLSETRLCATLLSDLRGRLDFKIIGYVLMPEHFDLLIWPSAQANPSRIVPSLKERTALFILKSLKENARVLRCQRMLDRLRLPPSVHGHGAHRVWQRPERLEREEAAGKTEV